MVFRGGGTGAPNWGFCPTRRLFRIGGNDFSRFSASQPSLRSRAWWIRDFTVPPPIGATNHRATPAVRAVSVAAMIFMVVRGSRANPAPTNPAPANISSTPHFSFPASASARSPVIEFPPLSFTPVRCARPRASRQLTPAPVPAYFFVVRPPLAHEASSPAISEAAIIFMVVVATPAPPRAPRRALPRAARAPQPPKMPNLEKDAIVAHA